MEVDGGSAGGGVLAPAGTQTSVSVSLHPLVILNISEHWTRNKAQTRAPGQVIGALLGKQSGRHLELLNSFEVKFDVIEGDVVIDRDFFSNREKLYKEVFGHLDFLGWYTTGEAPNASDVNVHRQMCEINESPIFLKMSAAAKAVDKLPIHVYESVIDLVNGRACLQFVELSFQLATEEAERIGVDHVAHITGASSGDASAVSKQLMGLHGALKMLHGRLLLLLEYLQAVEKGELPRNHECIRQIASLCHRLPVMDSARFRLDYQHQCNDITLIAYLGALTKASGSLNQLVNKLNVLHDRHGPSTTMRRGRGLLM